MTNLTDASCRVAFAALIHDLGKFAERAKIEISEDIKDRNKHTFCPKNYETQLYTHIHAAYTGIAFDQIEAFLPPVKNVDTFPFQIDQIDDSLETAAAKHHAPSTYLQHIISMADRLSSAFERTKYEEYNQRQEKGDYQTSRLVSLFEKLKGKDFEYTYPLKALSPHAIFPNLKSDPTKEQATLEYRELWNDFVRDIKKIKNRENWDLWLDAFDTLYATYTQNIPSASYRDIPDVSLYDHSKSTAALATALWRYHNETQTETLDNLKKDDKKFLLIQGDVSGIQNFIFDVGKKSRKYAYKMLRGRSFFVSLFSECAALRILKALDLPSTSQIMNAAGKFVIVAPNTSSSRQKVKALSKEFDQWFLSRQYAQISVGIATLEVTSQDFEQKNFGNLQERIYKSLGLAKMQKFNLCSCNGGIIKQFEEHYITDKGVCCFDGRLPAQAEADDEGNYSCLECLDILRIGEKLTKEHLISLDFTPFEDGLKTDILGIYIGWKKEADILRLWDISLPKDFDTPLFNGQARRYINAYVPRFTEADTSNVIYQGLDEPQLGALKTFSHLARENCQVIDGNLTVKPGLMILKGDIDNLGALFASVEKPTFATLAQLSRQLNNFFSVFLPYFCRTEKVAQNIYTIFAGGDDFYLIAPWLDGMNIVPIFKQKFKEYVANQDITFSLGMSMTKSGEDVLSQSNFVEQSLTQAKSYHNPINGTEKNAVCCFGQTVSFEEYNELLNLQNELDLFKQKYGLSIGYIYSLQKFCEQANRLSNSVNINEALNDALWRSRLVYKTVRFIENSSVSEENKTQAVNEICTHLGNAISKYKMHYIITLYSWLYQQREAQ